MNRNTRRHFTPPHNTVVTKLSHMNIIWAVRSLERLADRCQSIAEHIIYMGLGMDVRHIKLDDVLAESEAMSEEE